MKTASGMNSTLGALGGQLQQPSNAFGLLGGLLGNKPFGIIGADGARTGILADMFNGGGRGAAGDTFQGGILSGLLNAIGVRPAGYRARQMQPQMTEEQVRAQMGNAPSVMAPSPAATPSPTIDPAGVRTPLVPIDIAGPVRDLPPPPPSQMSLAGVPSATQRYFAQYGMATPQPRPAPSILDLENYLSGQTSNMTPYEMMLERARASGNPIMTTAPGSLRPIAPLGR